VNLYIRGDAEDNQFEVVVQDDQLRINGLEGTTINGEGSFVVADANVTKNGVTFAGGLRAHLGPGHDDFAITDAQFDSMSIIYGGTGDDSVDVAYSTFLERTVIQTFDGDDSVSTNDSHFEEELFAITLDGKDSVSIVDTMLAGNSVVVTGNHSDSIHSQSSHFMGEINLMLPLGGDDNVRIINPIVGEKPLGIFLGNGDDSIDADFMEAEIEGSVRIGGQAGTDRIDMKMSDEVHDNVTMGTFEADGGAVFGNLITDVHASWDAFTYAGSNDISFAPAELFGFEEDTTVTSIAFSGSYELSVPNAINDFVVRILANETGEETAYDGKAYSFNVPTDEVVYEAEFTVNDENRVATGVTYDGPGFLPHEIYNFTVDVAMQFEAGQKYWISVFQKMPKLTTANSDEFTNWFYSHSGETDTPLQGFSQFNNEWSKSYEEFTNGNTGLSVQLRS
jgi:hypothetical protein